MKSVNVLKKSSPLKARQSELFSMHCFRSWALFFSVHSLSLASHMQSKWTKKVVCRAKQKYGRFVNMNFHYIHAFQWAFLKDFLFHGFQRCLWICCEITSEIDNLTFHLMMKKELWFKINKTNRPVSAALRFLFSSFIGFRMSRNKKLHVQLVRKSIELKCKMKKNSFHTVNCKEDRKRFFSSNNDMKFDIFCVAHTVA